ncbi:MAG: YabP/YqfC family sporulation protein [Clostridia bacterium]|nr:YabP/YqfC family sporulation protein [Clostridia bacterium]
MREEEKNGKESFREKLCKKLDIDPDILPRGSLIELRGREALTVRGCGKILAYSPERIKLALGEGVLSVSGKRLVCISYYANAVGIEGYINTVSFEEDEI